MNNNLKKTLIKIGRLLNKSDITWGVGTSIMLFHHGIVGRCNDIDIQVKLEDIQKLDKILLSLGNKTIRVPNSTYKTIYFYEYIIDGIEVDVMAGFCICKDGKDHHIKFNEGSLDGTMEMEDTKIPLVRLEEWLTIYKLLPNREEKVKKIEEYVNKFN